MDIGKVFLDECRSKAIWLHDHNNNSALQIKNNGRTYYVIDETHLPVNTVIDNHLPKKSTVVGAPSTPDKTVPKHIDKDRMGDIGSVIKDYNNNPAQAPMPNNTPSRENTADLAKAKTSDKKNKDVSNPPEQSPQTTTNTNKKKEHNNINTVNEDLNTAPTPAGANTAKKEGKDNSTSKTDTINYRKRITSRELQNEKREQPQKNNADFEHDLKQLEQNNSTSNTATNSSDKQPSVPKASKKSPPKKNADFEKDLLELQGSTGQKNGGQAESKQSKTSKANIKKENAPTNSMEEDLAKIRVEKAGNNKKESTTITDTVNYRNQISKQKTTEK
jgi:hypothetical protein